MVRHSIEACNDDVVGLPSHRELLFATPKYVVMSVHIFVIVFASAMDGLRPESALCRRESMASESLAALRDNGCHET